MYQCLTFESYLGNAGDEIVPRTARMFQRRIVQVFQIIVIYGTRLL